MAATPDGLPLFPRAEQNRVSAASVCVSPIYGDSSSLTGLVAGCDISQLGRKMFWRETTSFRVMFAAGPDNPDDMPRPTSLKTATAPHTPARRGRPRAGLKPDERVRDYRTVTVRLPDDVRGMLKSLCLHLELPLWQTVRQLTVCYVRDLPASERRSVVRRAKAAT